MVQPGHNDGFLPVHMKPFYLEFPWNLWEWCINFGKWTDGLALRSHPGHAHWLSMKSCKIWRIKQLSGDNTLSLQWCISPPYCQVVSAYFCIIGFFSPPFNRIISSCMIRDVQESNWNKNMSCLSSYSISISNHVTFTSTSPRELTAILTWLVNEFFSFSFLQPSLMTQSNLLYKLTFMHIIYQSLSISSNRGSVFCSRKQQALLSELQLPEVMRRWEDTRGVPFTPVWVIYIVAIRNLNKLLQTRFHYHEMKTPLQMGQRGIQCAV